MNPSWLTSGKFWGRLFKWAVSIGLITYLLLTIDLNALAPIFRRLDFGWIAVALAVLLVARLITAFRWALLLRSQGIHLPVARALQLYFIGSFFGSVLPLPMGGEVIRAYKLSRLKGKTADSFVWKVPD